MIRRWIPSIPPFGNSSPSANGRRIEVGAASRAAPRPASARRAYPKRDTPELIWLTLARFAISAAAFGFGSPWRQGEIGMIRKLFAVLGGVLVMASLAQAQAPSFRWQKGQVLVYRTEHNTLASYVLDDNKSAVKTSVHSLRRWQVLDVDAAGVATMQLSITALRYEAVPEGSEPTVYDSAQPEKSSEQMRKQFSYIGQPLAVLRIDPQGKVLEVKEARSGFASAAKFESDPAFKMVLPAAALTAGQTWARDYQITLEPPQGTGEKFADVQRYS